MPLTWVPKTDGEIIYAAHINDLQTLKADQVDLLAVMSALAALQLLVTGLQTSKADLASFDQLTQLLTTGGPTFDHIHSKLDVVVTG